VADAIGAVERQTRDDAFRSVIASVRTRVEEGSQFSDALAQHPATFDGICRSLVCAGESSGRMDEMLARLSDMIRSQLKTRQTVANAMVYPCLLLIVSVGVAVAMLGFVLPRFEGLFQTLNAPLPTSTRLLMDLSAFIRQWWMVLLGIGAALGLGGRMYLATSGGADSFMRLVYSLPHIGGILRDITTARLSRVLGVLLTGRVGMVDALRLVKATASMPAYVQLLSRAEDVVTQGESLSDALNNQTLITPAVCEAVRSGERSGRVGQVLTQIADSMDEENELRVKTLTGLLEPVILLVMGLVIGCVAISMFLPLFDLTAAGRGSP
jgi:type II secretory pathway component PulF